MTKGEASSEAARWQRRPLKMIYISGKLRTSTRYKCWNRIRVRVLEETGESCREQIMIGVLARMTNVICEQMKESILDEQKTDPERLLGGKGGH